MTQDNSTFLGFDKKQIPLLSLILAGFIMLAGMFYQLNSNQNANHAATQADIHALHSRVDALQSVMVANDNALRADMNAVRDDMNALRTDINDLAVEMAETNARIVNIESRLPEYASVDERLDQLEREQARLSELVADLVNAE